ncbi:hypothetical protein ACOMHN_026360 [Nucella lapillus]
MSEVMAMLRSIDSQWDRLEKTMKDLDQQVNSLQSTVADLREEGTKPIGRVNVPKVEQEEKFSHWGPQNFLGWLSVRSRRSELDNSINSSATPPPSPSPPQRVSPETAAVGQSIMDDFVLFLTLKEAGLLDLCMQLK